MNRINKIRHKPLCLLTLPFLALIFSITAVAKDKLPETSHDGLQLQKHSEYGVVYIKPGATLKAYDKVTMTDIYVAFKKNWQRKYNRDEMGLDGRITDSDMENIKQSVARDFKLVFTNVLETGGYEVVDSTGADVLLLRPAIIDLVVNAPDTKRIGVTRTYANSAGELTLFLELFDSQTSTIIARIIDVQATAALGFAQAGNRVTNKSDLDRILRHWAVRLKDRLDAEKFTAASTDQ